VNNTEILLAILRELREIKTLLSSSKEIKPPNYRYLIADFPSFNWEAIGAKVVEQDKDGVASVSWNNYLYTRRSPSNNFSEAIWFSRSVGKDESGRIVYERLVTFELPKTAKRISREAEERLKMEK
jgi:hypothetical protein